MAIPVPTAASFRWPTVLAAVLYMCLIDSSQSMGVVARLRDKMASMPDDLPIDKPIPWDRWAWLAEKNHGDPTTAKRAALLRDLEADEADVREIPDGERIAADGGNEPHTTQLDDPNDVPKEERLVDDKTKRSQDTKAAMNGKRGRLNRPVVHAG